MDDIAIPPASLAQARRHAQACTRCPLYRNATRTVFGEGPADAALMLVGEQPGDREDREGRPFVGPAGRLLDRALADTGIDRKTVYLTNAVKHFKHEQRGTRRLHKRPNAGEVTACRWWLDMERLLVPAPVLVAMGATALHGLLGRATAIARLRGTPVELDDGRQLVATVHPSFLLRMPDRDKAAGEYRRFVDDLKQAAALSS